MRRTRVAAAIGLLLLTVPTAARAQEHSVSQQDLDAMVTAHAEQSNASRPVLEAFLARPDVVRAAADAGIDVRKAEAAVTALSSEDLAMQLDQLDGALAGGNGDITIPVTTVIIALLVLILIS